MTEQEATMAGKRWIAAEASYEDRMPALAPESLDEAQRKAVQELSSGPRGGVKGPFVALLRSPALLDRLGKVGEHLRFGSSLPARVSELVMLVVAREWTNRFEWAVHAPIARRRGVGGDVIDALAQGRYPRGMAADEEIAYEVCYELSRTKQGGRPCSRRTQPTRGPAAGRASPAGSGSSGPTWPSGWPRWAPG
jgi:4-carboxymuconolactone decarboxylase